MTLGVAVRRLEDLPVCVELPGALGEEVAAFVEGEAGWQVVGDSGPLTPVLTMAASLRPGVATVVVTDGAAGQAAVREALLGGALDVVAWPEERTRLLEAPLRIRAAAAAGNAPAVCRVAGAGGGAGTSTIALTIAALAGWAGRRALVVGGDDLLALAGLSPWQGPGAGELAVLDAAAAAAEVAGLALPVPAVDGLRVLGGGGLVRDVAGWPADLVVVDQRAPTSLQHADMVVARPDGCLRAAAGALGKVLVNGEGPLDAGGMRRALGRSPAGRLPASGRVARAGVLGRVPSGLPGSWVAQLRAVMESGPR